MVIRRTEKERVALVIENAVLWLLDVAFNEEQSRVRKDHSPETLAVLRRIALKPAAQRKDRQNGIRASACSAVGMNHNSSKFSQFDAIALSYLWIRDVLHYGKKSENDYNESIAS